MSRPVPGGTADQASGTARTADSHEETSPQARDGGRALALPDRRWLLFAPVVAAVVMLVALALGGGGPEDVVPGLPDPGPVTGWGLPLVRLLFDLSAVTVIGALLVAVMLPAADFGEVLPRALRIAGRAALTWAAGSLVLLWLTVSDVLGVAPSTVFSAGHLSAYGWQLAQGRSLLLVVACGVVLYAYARWVRTRGGTAVLLTVAVAALLPVLYSGHSAAAADHDLATSSLVVHVLAAALWVGGLVGVLVLLRDRPRTLAQVLPRYSALALVCFCAVAFSGLLNAWVRTSGDLALWAGSGYGALLLAKLTCLAALGAFGWQHRRRTVADVTAGRPRAFARLATGEVLVMAATVGVAVALSRTPPPVGATQDAPSHGFGHPTLGDDVAPFTLLRLLTEWRPEAISLVLVAVLLGAYLAGVRRLERAGRAWPMPRTAAAAAAAGIAVLATSGGLATYAAAMFSMQVVQFLTLFVVVPVLAALSAPMAMLVEIHAVEADVHDGEAAQGHGSTPRAQPVHAWLPEVLRTRTAVWLLDPLNVLIVVTLIVFALYATPLLEASLRSAPLHLLVNLSVLLAGFLFWWTVLAVDPAAPVRPRSYRLGVFVGLVFLLVAIAVRIYMSDVVLAGDWFAELDWEWVEIPDDQRRGAVYLAGGVLVFTPLLLGLMRNGRDRTESATATTQTPALRADG